MKTNQLRQDARAIWDAAVAAANPDKLIKDAVRVDGGTLTVGPRTFDLAKVRRIAVVGCGKAGTAMARALEEVLGEKLLEAKQLVGWVNVPDDCAGKLSHITLHGSRPPGQNSPAVAGVRGTEEMLRILNSLRPTDIAICLISGGGSALMPAPVDQVPLEDKQAVTDLLSKNGATINELNAVRKHLSRVKGGHLAAASCAGETISLIISDVVGNPLDVIASGPTAPDHTTFADALAVFDRLGVRNQAPAAVVRYIERGAAGEFPETMKALPDSVTNVVIGDNAIALKAAEAKAKELGYNVLNLGSYIEGETQDVGIVHAALALSVTHDATPLSPPACILSGGETTVSNVAEGGKGGRNQEFVLAALDKLQDRGIKDMLILSGGTDGEDGPTDAAGAFADEAVLSEMLEKRVVPGEYLCSSRSYDFFDQLNALLKTGPTHTNVMDVRVILVA
ncbi:MAG: DUF4147 domain-containing protein [Planctomycetes bacterium]|nr:DUF4147 domain-containing protein [Planctomycetota bacterium]